MDTLDKTEWDILINGTGLQQSLLALYVPRNLLTIFLAILTDAEPLEELYRAPINESSMSTPTTITEVMRPP